MEKKKFKFNIIDIIIIIVVVAAIIFLGAKILGGNNGAAVQDLYRITFYTEGVENYVIENTKIGDPAYDDSGKSSLGKVVELRTEPSVGYKNDKGEYVHEAREDLSALYITVEVNGVESEYGVRVDGTLYGVGHTTILRAGMGKYYLPVQAIEKIG